MDNLLAGLNNLTQALTAQAAAIGNQPAPVPRTLNLVKIEPFFGDSQDPIGWLEDFENATNANGMNDADRVRIVAAYLKGPAHTWYTERQTNQATQTTNWAHNDGDNAAAINHTFYRPFTTKFRNRSKVSAWRQELDSHTQGPHDSVEVYVTKLRELLRRVDPNNALNEEFKIFYFERRLLHQYKVHTKATDVETLDEAIEVARKWE